MKDEREHGEADRLFNPFAEIRWELLAPGTWVEELQRQLKFEQKDTKGTNMRDEIVNGLSKAKAYEAFEETVRMGLDPQKMQDNPLYLEVTRQYASGARSLDDFRAFVSKLNILGREVWSVEK